jgi:hypothetical protein
MNNLKLFYCVGALLGGLYAASPAQAQISVGMGVNLPGVSIGIDLPGYPQLVPVPGYPVYYDPSVDANYFFYDGLYWVYRDDNWYRSSWYNGPWYPQARDVVPLFVLRVPVRYYRAPPVYFRGWRADAPPRWGVHWGPSWEASHRGWDHWNRASAPRRAPLPVYQRNYSGDRYPRATDEQYRIRADNYHYQPHDRSPHLQIPRPAQPDHGPAHNAPPRPQQQPQQQPQRMPPPQAHPQNQPQNQPQRNPPPQAQPHRTPPPQAQPRNPGGDRQPGGAQDNRGGPHRGDPRQDDRQGQPGRHQNDR